MKILILAIGISLVSCKKNFTCECSIERTLIFETFEGKEYYKTTDYLGSMTEKNAKSVCVNKKVIDYHEGYKAIENHKCELK